MMLFMLAAGIGAVLRYLADLYMPSYGVLVVNILGALFSGVVLGLALQQYLTDTFVTVLLGGFAGSLTTFSTVAVQTAQQQRAGAGGVLRTWSLHVGLSVAGALCGLALSLWLPYVVR